MCFMLLVMAHVAVNENQLQENHTLDSEQSALARRHCVEANP